MGHIRREALQRVRRQSVALVLMLTTLGCVATSQPIRNAALNRRAPEFTAQTLDGTPVHLSSLHGKVVILHIWAAWDCAEELAGLDEIASRVRSQDVAVVAVSIDREASGMRAVEKSRTAWNLTLLHDPTAQTARLYDPRDFPAAYIIDRDGIIRYEHAGLSVSDLHRIEAEAKELGSNPPGSRPTRARSDDVFSSGEE